MSDEPEREYWECGTCGYMRANNVGIPNPMTCKRPDCTLERSATRLWTHDAPTLTNQLQSGIADEM